MKLKTKMSEYDEKTSTHIPLSSLSANPADAVCVVGRQATGRQATGRLLLWLQD